MVKVIDEFNLEQKRTFIRVDFNVTAKDGKIIDDSRIRACLPTIEYALSRKARVILASHLGRPKGVRNEKDSLLPVAECLSALLNKEVIVPEDCVGDAVRKLVGEMRDGNLILLENLRFQPGEEKNDPQFAAALAGLADIYINDAFGAAHRAHASTVGMVGFFKEKGIGFLMKKELDAMQALLAQPQRPFLAILGGAKVSDKIGVIDNLMNHVDVFLMGGGMAYTFLKATGKKVGRSLVEEAKLHQAEKILQRAELKGIKIHLPVDAVVAEKLEEGTEWKVKSVDEDWESWMGLDVGPQTLKMFAEKIIQAKTIFWNGPVGVFEIPPFDRGTMAVAQMIAASDAVSVVGGGHSSAAVRQSGPIDRFTHISTGGGASMEYLEGKTLPGLKVLETR